MAGDRKRAEALLDKVRGRAEEAGWKAMGEWETELVRRRVTGTL